MSTFRNQKRQDLIRFMLCIQRPVSSDELLRRLKEARRPETGNQDPIYGTMASQNNALATELSRDLAQLTEDKALSLLDDGTFTVEHRVAMPS